MGPMSSGPFFISQNAVFISDVHLDAGLSASNEVSPSSSQAASCSDQNVQNKDSKVEPLAKRKDQLRADRTELFHRYLERLALQPPESLILVGDIFDLWVGPSSYFAGAYAESIARLKQLSNRGVKIHYFEGNHDFHLARYFEAEGIASVHAGPARFKVAGRDVQVEHGDEADPSDRGYLFLRWLLRSPFVTLLARVLPGQWTAWIGQGLSRASRKWTDYRFSRSAIDRLQTVIRAHAAKRYRELPFDFMVTGHLHVRDEWILTENGAEAVSLNLGSWLNADGSNQIKVLEIGPQGHQWHELTT